MVRGQGKSKGLIQYTSLLSVNNQALGYLTTQKPHLCQCESCAEVGDTVGSYSDWGIALRCDDCDVIWILCLRCPGARVRMVTMGSVKNHNKKYHPKQSRRKRICSRINLTSENNNDPGWLGDDNEEETLGEHEQSQISIEGIRHNNDDNDILVFDHDTDNSAHWIACHGESDFGHESLASEKYFHHQHLNEGMSGGMQYLVKRSLVQRDLQFCELKRVGIPEGEDILMMKMAKLAFTLSSTQHQLLADVIHGCYALGCGDGYKANAVAINDAFNNFLVENNYQISPRNDLIADNISTDPFDFEKMKIRHSFEGNIPIPSCTNDFRKYFTEGKHAIVPNLPIPTIKTDIKGHATVSIIDCVRDFLSHHCGNERLEAITPSTSHSNGIIQNCCQSRRGKEILDRSMAISVLKGIPMIALRLDFWSDDFEPNNTKDNRQSVWVKTFTIGTLREDGQQIRATYPVAVGTKGDSHNDVERQNWNELKQLSSANLEPFYIGSKKSKVHLHVALFSILQDQPERRSSNYLLNTNSTYLNRWGVSAYLSALHPVLISCDGCYNTMLTKYKNKDFGSCLPRCDRCLNWDVLSAPNSPISLTNPPRDYPLLRFGSLHNSRYSNSPCCRLVVTDTQEQLLKPFPITYDDLKESVSLAYDMFQSRTWTKCECTAYLKVEGLCDKYIDTFLENANNALALSLAEQESDPILTELQALKADEPEKFACPENPAVWEREGVPLTATIDAIMHLLFLGIVKSLLLLIQDWLKRQEKFAAFMRSFPSLLEPIVKMSLDWLSLQPYKGDKFGGWVSENYLGFSRIMMWFFQNLEQTCPDLSDKIPPEGTPPDKWLKRHCEFWLKCRGLDKEGKVGDLRERVAYHLNQPEGPPEPQRQNPKDVEDVVTICSDMLACIMDDKVTDYHVGQAECTIRLFLQHYDRLDASIRTTNAKPEVISKPNFCCLLNLPITMQTYGPLRNLWEGACRGEGFLRFLKPLIGQAVRHGWQMHALKRALRNKSLDSVTATTTEQNQNKAALLTKDGLRCYSRKFHKYESQYQFVRDANVTDVDSKVPLSVIILDIAGQSCRIFGIVGDFDSLVEIRLQRNHGEHIKYGLSYWKFSVTLEEGVLSWENDIVSNTSEAKIGFAVLLPLLDNDNENENSQLFAMVSSNWRSLCTPLSLSDLI